MMSINEVPCFLLVKAFLSFKKSVLSYHKFDCSLALVFLNTIYSVDTSHS